MKTLAVLALAVLASSTRAQPVPECDLSLGLDYRGPTFATVGSVVPVVLTLRTEDISGPLPVVQVSDLDFRLDCVAGSGATDCQDEGSVIAYGGDQTIVTSCAGGTVWTTGHGPTDAPNIVTLHANPPATLVPQDTCTVEFKVVVVGLSHDGTPQSIEEEAQVTHAACSNGLGAAPWAQGAIASCPNCNDGVTRTLDTCDGETGMCLNVRTSRRGR